MIKLAISRMDRYHLMVELAIRRFCDEGLLSTVAMQMDEIKRLESEHVMFYGSKNWEYQYHLDFPVSKKKTKDYTLGAIRAMRNIMESLSPLIVDPICHPVSIEVDGKACKEFPQLEPFPLSLKRLVSHSIGANRGRRFKESPSPVLSETEAIEKAVADVKDQILKGLSRDKTKLKRSISLLANSSLKLKVGLELLNSVANRMLEELKEGNNKIMEMML
ncbi:hypothetical protein Tsubulata_018205 [Turnera subulata]|uniref:Uncharacterized protein n=1 Tax=Turnera subulata TaxID=218843 RepID=A0A9Q0FAX5_9ROSI|nr:hypothetical protein Tsubulata_018205 [Turnera subulata]